METFLAVLRGHLLADFPLQPAWMIQWKKHPAVLGLHIALVGRVAILTSGDRPATLLVILMTTHPVMDAIKVCVLEDSLRSFVVDQVVHLVPPFALCPVFPGRSPSYP